MPRPRGRRDTSAGACVPDRGPARSCGPTVTPRLAVRAGSVRLARRGRCRASVRSSSSSHEFRGHQQAGLVLEDPRIKGREDRPDPVLGRARRMTYFAPCGWANSRPIDHAVLPDADEPVRVAGLDVAQAAADQVGDVVDHRARLRAAADLQRLQRRDAAELGAAEAGDVREAVLGQPARALARMTRTAAIGYIPPDRPLPVTRMSGSIPCLVIAHISPVRISPVCTSSAMYIAPCRSHERLTASR